MSPPIVAFDTETELFRAGRMAPPLVCVSMAFPVDYQAVGGPVKAHTHITKWEDSLIVEMIEQWLDSYRIVGHEVSYDMCVLAAQWPHLLPKIFKAYEEDRVTDTKLRQQLLDIAAGCHRGEVRDGQWHRYNYGLADLAHRFLGKTRSKGDDTWRKRYGELRDVPLSQWPQDAIDYPLEDAADTLAIYQLQEKHAQWLEDQYRQARAYFALKLCSNWGIRTDLEGVECYARVVEEKIEIVKARLIESGLVRKDGTRDMKAARSAIVRAFEELGKKPVLTKTGEPALDRDTCEMVDDPVIQDYAEYQTLLKTVSNDIPMLRSGSVLPIHPSYGLADTGRTTCANPNIQNLKRSG